MGCVDTPLTRATAQGRSDFGEIQASPSVERSNPEEAVAAAEAALGAGEDEAEGEGGVEGGLVAGPFSDE